MNNSTFYNEIMMVQYLPKFKFLRDQWEKNKTSMDISYYSALGNDWPYYLFLVEESKKTIIEMLDAIILSLMDHYNYSYNSFSIKWSGCELYQALDNNEIITNDNHSRGSYFCIVKGASLIIFKEFGLTKRVPKQYITKLQKEYGFKDYCYVSYVEKEAYNEVINHNNNPKDPSRGTGVFSLKFFIEHMFGVDEYKCFKSYFDRFSSEIQKYYGIKTVKTLSPNSLATYKEKVQESICSFDYYSNLNLEENVINEINNQFFKQEYYKCLLGENNFAVSFLTSEWLFHSLQEAGLIDLTPIALGYFKATEQLLYSLACFHTIEQERIKGTNVRRTIQINEHYIPSFTDQIATENKDLLSLGVLKSFFSYYYNKDLIREEVRDKVFGQIKKTLLDIKELRNGYLHKDNLYDDTESDVVQRIRNNTLCVFYLMLGAYQIETSDLAKLGMPKDDTSNAEKLCRYIHSKVGGSNKGIIPVFFINESTNKESALFACRDNNVTHKRNGDAVHTGIYFSRKDLENLGSLNEEHIQFGIDSLPNVVYEGRLIPHVDDHQNFIVEITKPEKKIFENGVFFGNT